MKKTIIQEDLMGCGIACVACVLNKSYKITKRLFKNPEFADKKGYYCRELVEVLNNNGKNYSFANLNKTNYNINKIGVIVFIEKNSKYPGGHYLIKTNNGWMDPWINYLKIFPVKSRFRKRLPGKAQWIIYPTN